MRHLVKTNYIIIRNSQYINIISQVRLRKVLPELGVSCS